LLRAVTAVAGVVVLTVVAAGAVFVAGMRTKAPVVLDAVRRFNRAVTNPWVTKTAGAAGAGASLIRHTGRRTGRGYATPVGAIATPDGFVVALPYGTRADWLKNVLASGTATIVDGGITYPVDRPAVVATADVARHLPPGERRMLRLFHVDRCLSLRHADPSAAGAG
jgi:deazaflavin-dependent oxidoreductase (nitroreductase family)